MVFASVNEIFEAIPKFFNADAARGMDAVFQFDISGEDGGVWHLTVREGTYEIKKGRHDNPAVTLTMSAETWLGILNKDLNAMKAFMFGKLKVNGDMMLAQRIPRLFSL
jgi:putative sterol carrier protein